MHSDAVGAQLFVQGSALTSARRAAMKAKLKAGALDELLFSVVTFRDGPNVINTCLVWRVGRFRREFCGRAIPAQPRDR